MTCETCLGACVIGVRRTRAMHACGGDERLCATLCPIEAEEIGNEPCPDCWAPDSFERMDQLKPPLGLRREDAILDIAAGDLSEAVRAKMRGHRCYAVQGAVGTKDRWHMTVLASIDGQPGERKSLHVSISHTARYPTWEEIKAVRAWAWDEDTEVVMVLARRRDYVNIAKNCFHLWTSRCGKEGR